MMSRFSRGTEKKKVLMTVCALLALLLASCSPSVAVASNTTPSASPPTSQPQISSSPTRLPLEYISPLPNAQYVLKDDTIILRFGPALNAHEVASLKITVAGSESGPHPGKTILADDQQTVLFKPDQPYSAGEQVHVQVNSLGLDSGVTYQPLSYTFNVATNQQAGAVASTSTPTSTPQSAFPYDLTLPPDIPHYSVSVTSPTTAGEGDIFVAPFYWTASSVGSYLLVLDNNGQIVYYQSEADQQSAFDFKVLPSGYLTYYDLKDAVHVILDSNYQVVGIYSAQNGYTADLHDFLMTPGGYVFLMAYDTETVDMSKIVPGGNPNAAVTGLVIQELDPNQNVIFEWRSWDHFAFSDTNANLTQQQIDLVHGNGLALTSDGNLLLSSRNLSEVTKINLQTGDIMWRLGGKHSTFTFVNDGGFAYQHNIGVLPNGDITLFDNHGTDQAPAASRAVEYQLDLANKTVTLVWEYTHTPPVFTDYMGNVERLPDGNMFIGWGNAGQTGQSFVLSSITEVTPDNQVVFELTFDEPYVSYRAFREAWVGTPITTPALAFEQNQNSLTLGYSWNGATEVASWELFGGTSPQKLNLIDTHAKTRFETQTYLMYVTYGMCYFQVAALDKSGTELARSAVISTDQSACPP
jgi:hypothetical protein